MPAETMAWPAGCHDAASCERHRVCMYHQCAHTGKGAALGSEIDAAVAASKFTTVPAGNTLSIAISNPNPNPPLIIRGATGTVVTLHFNPHRVEIAEGVTMDEAAREFWSVVQRLMGRTP